MTAETSAVRRRLPRSLRRVLIAVMWLGLWWLIYAWVNQDILVASPLHVVDALLGFAGDGQFWLAIAFLFARIVAGFVLGMVVAVVLAVAAYLSSWVHDLFLPVIRAIRATPVASFIILALVWLDKGEVPICAAFLVVLPIAWENTFDAIMRTDGRLLDMAHVFQLRRFAIIRHIYLPSVMPSVITACSIAIGMAWKAAIAAEVLGAPQHGIGTGLYDSKIYLDTPGVFAWTAVVIGLSVVFERAVLALLRRANATAPATGPVAESEQWPEPETGRWPVPVPSLRPGAPIGAGVTVTDVSTTLGGAAILHRFSLEVPERGCVCLFGRSGCGKTTLLQAIAGIGPIDAGTVTVGGGGVVSMSFEDDRLLPWLTAVQNVELVLGGQGSHDQAMCWLDHVGLGGDADKLVTELSGGMRRRVTLARALAFGGDLLVLDEPCQGVDADTKRAIIALMAAAKRERPVLLVTHDVDEAIALADMVHLVSGPPLTIDAPVPIRDCARTDSTQCNAIRERIATHAVA